MPVAFFWTSAWASVATAAGLAVVVAVAAAVSRGEDGEGGLVTGGDGRTLASKVAVLAWMLVVAWFVGTLFLGGEAVFRWACPTGPLTPGPSDRRELRSSRDPDCRHLEALHDGWARFVDGGLRGEYLVLVGIPSVVATAAAVTTTTRRSAGTTLDRHGRRTGRWRPLGVLRRAAGDRGPADVLGLQFAVFNVVVLVSVVEAFVSRPARGLPGVPATLLGLLGVSGSLYVVGRVAVRRAPKVRLVVPTRGRPGSTVEIHGRGLGGHQPPLVTFGGARSGDVAGNGDMVTAVVPADAPHGPADVVALPPGGRCTPALSFEVLAARPAIVSVRPARVALGEDRVIQVVCRSFLPPGQAERTARNAVLFGGRPLFFFIDDDVVKAMLPTAEEAAKVGQREGPVDVVVLDHDGVASEPAAVELVVAERPTAPEQAPSATPDSPSPEEDLGPVPPPEER